MPRTVVTNRRFQMRTRAYMCCHPDLTTFPRGQAVSRAIRKLLPCFLLLLAPSVRAQSSSSPAAGQQTDAVEVTLGEAAVPLYGPWKFTVSDSPMDPKTGRPLWAEPGFDDSHWETVDLAPKEGSVDPTTGVSDWVPGWTARGHADYAGYAWYRIRLRCESQGGQALAMTGPADLDDAYQVFAGGKLLGAFGNFSAMVPVVYYTRPLQFQLAETCRQAGATQVLAFRFWMQPSTLLSTPDAGGMHSAPLLGEATVIGMNYRLQWLEQIRSLLTALVETVLFSVLAIVAFSLILFDRSDSVYLWIGLLFLAIAASSGWIAAAGFILIPIRIDLLVEIVVTLALLSLWNMVWWVWFGRVGFRWLPRALVAMAVPYVIVRILGREIFPGLVSHTVAHYLFNIYQGLRFVFFGVMVWIAVDGIRRKGFDGWLVLPVVLLWGVFSFSAELIRLHLYTEWFPFGVPVDPAEIALVLAAAVIALLLLRRLLRSVRRQRERALDVKQAQEVSRSSCPSAASRCKASRSRPSIARRLRSAATSSRSSRILPTAACSLWPATWPARVSRPACWSHCSLEPSAARRRPILIRLPYWPRSTAVCWAAATPAPPARLCASPPMAA
jgi:hypothetical protein